ncbi:hypothetical protein Taro_026798 [Colocasia esculenta]|uniref:Bifunctional inhibitor/plant lipid transfer protein/seed storage helical domain-containing protein n=1 Tax=Colocasia esculenta TaxID=4460 RepID=A0A843VDW2_COLES|nr:hypothetical protein [Colocasia esculenta]
MAMAGKAEGLRRLPLLLTMTLLGLWAGAARGDFASDQAECAESLVGLSTCLTYVEGTSHAPTPDCCSGLKQVIGKSPKCLCVLIKDRNEPQLGFKIDPNRAISLPSTCNAPVNIYHCIDLLKLDPNSKDAEIFKQFGNTTIAGTSPAGKAAPSGGGSSSAASSGGAAPASKTNDKSDAIGLSHRLGWWRWVGAEEVGGIWASCALAVSLVILSG